jgi:hypothetical protein
MTPDPGNEPCGKASASAVATRGRTVRVNSQIGGR